MQQSTRILQIRPLPEPHELLATLPANDTTTVFVNQSRQAIHRILHGADHRLIVIVGPCSIHDPEAAIEYARRLKTMRERFGHELEIVMRTYFEKPRTTVGWKGLINDPDQNGSGDIGKGLHTARSLLLEINKLGVPAATEFLDLVSPHYLADLVSWGAIGARTTESQVHRELASSLPCAIGFKNGTDGNVKIAIDAVRAASQPHHFLSMNGIVSSSGNPDAHIILRGGKEPNFDAVSVDAACGELARNHCPARLIIDASHANSRKNHENQIPVCADISQQLAAGDERIIGVMIESNLVAGRQDEAICFGQSITDACIGWSETELLLESLAHAVCLRKQMVLQPESIS
jgi:3-deoxy-7-phosphoheptulonate synthase